MESSRILIAILVFIVLVSGVVYFSFIRDTYSFEPTTLSSKPDITGCVMSNSDFIYSRDGWFDRVFRGNTIVQKDWDTNGWHETDVLYDRGNFIVLQPFDDYSGRYIEKTVTLSDGSHRLLVGVANVNGGMDYTSHDDSGVYDDVKFLISIGTKNGGKRYSDEITVSKDMGWVDLSYRLDEDLSNTDVVVRVESVENKDKYGKYVEWSAVDYLCIV